MVYVRSNNLTRAVNPHFFSIKEHLFLWQIHKNSTKIIKTSDEIQGNINSTEKSCTIQPERENPTVVMKATATVSPLFNFETKSTKIEHIPPANEEGSFAAALKKLAQQTPNFPVPHSGGFQISPSPRERLNSSPPSKGILHLQSLILTRDCILFSMTEHFFLLPQSFFLFFFLFVCLFVFFVLFFVCFAFFSWIFCIKSTFSFFLSIPIFLKPDCFTLLSFYISCSWKLHVCLSM